MYAAYVVAVVVLLFGATIFAHELGHFLSARLLGMVIDVFSIGFGPAIWKKKFKGIVYQIACVPVGGYVALPQMEPQFDNSARDPEGPDQAGDGQPAPDQPAPSAGGPASSSSGQTRHLPRVAPWKKMIVAVAGPMGNIILAVLIAWIVYWVGKPSTPAERCAVIGFVETNSLAYVKGIRTGDEIVAVNGRRVNNWNDVLQENARFENVALTIKRGEELMTVPILTERNVLGFRVVGGLRETTVCKVKALEPGSSAELAGIRSGDVVKTFDGIEVLSVDHLISLVSDRPDLQTPITLDRDGDSVRLPVTPRVHPEIGRAVIGIHFDLMAFDYDQRVFIRPGIQLQRHATVILRVVRSLMTPKEARATSEGLGGPFIIIFMFAEMVRKSFVIALWFTCFLNVNLAILNLLPIPILDGGHVVFSLWELVIRRPVHPKVVIWLSHIFAGLLIFAFVLLSGRDLQRIFRILQLSKPPAARDQPTNNAIPAADAEFRK